MLTLVGSPDAIAKQLAARVDRHDGRLLADQIAELLWTDIMDGTLEQGDRLPTVRQVAIAVGVHPRVVEQAFARLEQRGVIRSEPGGIFVCIVDSDSEPAPKAGLDELCRDAVARAEALGFTIDDLVEGLADLRADRRSRDRS